MIEVLYMYSIETHGNKYSDVKTITASILKFEHVLENVLQLFKFNYKNIHIMAVDVYKLHKIFFLP